MIVSVAPTKWFGLFLFNRQFSYPEREIPMQREKHAIGRGNVPVLRGKLAIRRGKFPIARGMIAQKTGNCAMQRGVFPSRINISDCFSAFLVILLI